MTITAAAFWLEGVGDFTAAAGSRGAMKTAKSQVGRPRGWVRAPIVQTGMIRAMMRGCGVALLGSSPLDLRLCRPHHMYMCSVSVSSRRVSGQNAVPGIGSDSGNMSENARFGGVALTPLRRAAAWELTETLHLYMMGPAES